MRSYRESTAIIRLDVLQGEPTDQRISHRNRLHACDRAIGKIMPPKWTDGWQLFFNDALRYNESFPGSKQSRVFVATSR
jgi:hypothetical protein